VALEVTIFLVLAVPLVAGDASPSCRRFPAGARCLLVMIFVL
jgi:hypothetical protein